LGPRERLRPADSGAIIIVARTELGLTAEQFATVLGVAPSKVSEWARGLVRPGLDGVLRICQLGGWSTRAFLEGRLEASGASRRPKVAIPEARVANNWNLVRAKVRRRLLRSGPPPTMREIAASCGVGPRWLSKKLPPDLRAEIRERRSAWVAERAVARVATATVLIATITAELLAEGFAASRRQVEARLTGSLSLREPALNEAWRSAQPKPHSGADA
jgi:transcriptional regulator with XRE-family HTH domain